MAKKSPPTLSAAEQAIMDALWKSHPVSVLDLLEAVNAGRKEPITRNTLQTQLTRLEAKGWIKRDDSGRTHLYDPVVQETHGRTSVLAELKKRFFGGSSLALVRCLVESGDISESELAELRKLVRDHSKTKPTPKP
jgi:predicted transcriptional regulator